MARTLADMARDASRGPPGRRAGEENGLSGNDRSRCLDLLISAPLGQRTSPYCKFGFVYEFTIELCPLAINRPRITVNCKLGCLLAFASLVTKYLNVRTNILHRTTSEITF
jgi:hypothetical protein